MERKQKEINSKTDLGTRGEVWNVFYREPRRRGVLLEKWQDEMLVQGSRGTTTWKGLERLGSWGHVCPISHNAWRQPHTWQFWARTQSEVFLSNMTESFHFQSGKRAPQRPPGEKHLCFSLEEPSTHPILLV